MDKKDKSLLDRMEIKETVNGVEQRWGAKNPLQTIVSSCPKCGAPIYGKATVLVDEVPTVKRTCSCSNV